MHSNRPTSQVCLRVALIAVTCSPLLIPAPATAQVRTKRPDRGVYQSPRIQPETSPTSQSESLRDVISRETREAETDRGTSAISARDESPLAARDEVADLVRAKRPDGRPKPLRPLVEVTLETAGATNASEPPPGSKETEAVRQVSAHSDSRQGRRSAAADRSPRSTSAQARQASAQHDQAVTRPHSAQAGKPLLDPEDSTKLRPVAHEDVVLVRPSSSKHSYPEPIVDPWVGNGQGWDDGTILHDSTCDGCGDCDSLGCDSLGCDSMGCSKSPWYRGWANSSLSWNKNRWFGSIELLLMFRRGDRLPPLVTTGPATDPDTAGEFGQIGTQVLVGESSIFKHMRAGGRLTLGTWIDPQQCRSLVMRGWFAGEKSYDFHANQDQIPVIARPFLNVSDNQAATQDTQLVAFPNRASGSINVRGKSDVFGADVELRQFWFGKYGGSVDFLYGYQYMRLNEDIGISSTTTSLDDDFAPLGSVISISDDFEAENDFHGGQVGLSSRYREGCWSFNALAKVGFGSLRRRAKLTGATVTSIDGVNAFDPNGLLVRSTNQGTITDHTFGWVPEIDLSIGWQKYPNFDVTFGYNIIAMTDSLQVSGIIDPALAVNLSDPPTGQQRPTALLNYQTYYVQGIHFGIQHVY